MTRLKEVLYEIEVKNNALRNCKGCAQKTRLLQALRYLKKELEQLTS